MLRPEPRQIIHDFTTTVELGERYFPEEVRDDAIEAARHVNGVTPYLSRMAAGELNMTEGVMYGIAVAGIDVVTDYHDERLSGRPIALAFAGDPEYEALEPISFSEDLALDDGYRNAIHGLASAQDHSRLQMGDITADKASYITRQKGGYAFLSHLCAVKEGVTHPEQEAAMEVGYVLQLLDDYLDQPEDRADGISTVFTESDRGGSWLDEKIDDVAERCRDVWGDTEATEQFVTLMRYHKKAGWIENNTPASPSWVLPWYF